MELNKRAGQVGYALHAIANSGPEVFAVVRAVAA